MAQRKGALSTLVMMVLVANMVGMSACNSCKNADKAAASADGSLKEDVSATVNGISLKRSELDVLHKKAAEKYAKAGRPLAGEFDRRLRASFLRKMIDDELFSQSAEKNGIKIDRFERVDGLEKYKERIGGQSAYLTYLQKEGLTQEQVEKTILKDLLRDKVITKLSTVEEPTEEEILNYYRGNERVFTQPEMVRARHILVKLDPKDPQAKVDAALKKAKQILEDALKPGASFVDLVQKYSEGPSVKSGGDLGLFARGRMVKSFEDLAFSAPLKTPVGPVKTDFGYHVVYVEEKTSAKPAPLESVRPRVVDAITRTKRMRKGEELIATLRQSAQVKVLDYAMTQEEYKNLLDSKQVANKSE